MRKPYFQYCLFVMPLLMTACSNFSFEQQPSKTTATMPDNKIMFSVPITSLNDGPSYENKPSLSLAAKQITGLHTA